MSKDPRVIELQLSEQCRTCINKDKCRAHLPDSQPCLGWGEADGND